MCHTNFRFLQKLTEISVDGTFYCTPKFFKSFIVHGYRNNVSLPLAFFLLPDKNASSYKTAFSIFITQLFRPEIIYADFELAIHTAIREVLPGTKIFGCRFHLGQNWYKKILQLGLSKEYKNSIYPVAQFLKCFFGLLFLDPTEIDDCFMDDLMSVAPDEILIHQFCD